jgi:ABC-2 type transport system permease protein
VDGMREIMLQGKNLAEVGFQCGVLMLFAVITTLLASLTVPKRR